MPSRSIHRVAVYIGALLLGLLVAGRIRPGGAFWWQLSEGQRILRDGAIAPFESDTYTSSPFQELAPTRLFTEAGIAWICARAGPSWALAGAAAFWAMGLLSLWLALLRSGGGPVRSSAVIAIVIAILSPRMTADDGALAFFLMCLLAALSSLWREDPPMSFWLLPVLVVWIGGSPTFVIGITWTWLQLAGEALDTAREAPGVRTEVRDSLLKVSIILLPLPLFSPGSAGGAREALQELLAGPGLPPGALAPEWSQWAWGWFALLVMRLPSSGRQPTGTLLAGLTLGLYAALAPHTLPLALAAGAPLWMPPPSPDPRHPPAANAVILTLTALAIAALLSLANARPYAVEEALLPALPHLAETPGGGTMFGEIPWGGFLSRVPGLKAPSATQRIVPFDNGLHEDHMTALEGPSLEILDVYGTDTVVLLGTRPLARVLEKTRGWTAVHRSSGVLVFRRWEWFRGGVPRNVIPPRRP